MSDIARRTRRINATKLTFDQRAECEKVLEWLTDDPETVARYVVILEALLPGDILETFWEQP